MDSKEAIEFITRSYPKFELIYFSERNAYGGLNGRDEMEVKENNELIVFLEDEEEVKLDLRSSSESEIIKFLNENLRKTRLSYKELIDYIKELYPSIYYEYEEDGACILTLDKRSESRSLEIESTFIASKWWSKEKLYDHEWDKEVVKDYLNKVFKF